MLRFGVLGCIVSSDDALLGGSYRFERCGWTTMDSADALLLLL